MKISEAINRANALRDNVLSDEQKAEWLCQLDGQLNEMIGIEPPVEPDTDPGTEPVEEPDIWPFVNTWPEQDEQLLMPAPHDDVYPLYLVAMIDYYNQESALYANDMAIYNAAMSAARAWWRRNNRPGENRYWGVM